MADNLQKIHQELHDLSVNVKVGRAETANALIRLRNLFISPSVLDAVQKTVPGSGIQLARALAPDQAARDAINHFAINHPEVANADVGSCPAFFDALLDGYEYIDCLKLILFYNEDMGIVAGSEVWECRKAVRDWLKTF
ncbi:hypothetical protein BDZ97DRAFT_1840384 [Flammula alnicola]|nr:hypothetical protein BDZ97DRAFT_1840384 [Flammula alnicola]